MAPPMGTRLVQGVQGTKAGQVAKLKSGQVKLQTMAGAAVEDLGQPPLQHGRGADVKLAGDGNADDIAAQPHLGNGQAVFDLVEAGPVVMFRAHRRNSTAPDVVMDPSSPRAVEPSPARPL